MTNPIQQLHDAYCAATGFEIELDAFRRHTWEEWLRKKFTVADLELVIRYLLRGIKDRSRNIGCLKFTNIVGYPDRFEEELALAKQSQRVAARLPKVDGNRADVLRATGREAAVASEGVKTPSDVLKMRSLEELAAEMRKAIE